MKNFLILFTLSLVFTSSAIAIPNDRQASFKWLGHAPLQEQVTFRVWLKYKDSDALEDFLKRLYIPTDPLYQHFLTPAQFKNQFSPTERQIEAVKTFLSSNGMYKTRVGKNNTYIEVSASVAQIEPAFHLQLNQYRYQNETILANATLPIIPESLTNTILTITGLNTLPFASMINKNGVIKPRTHSVYSGPNGLYSSLNADLLDTDGSLLISNMLFKGFVQSTATSPPSTGGYSVTQLRHAYGVDQLISRGLDGSGQTIVIPWAGITTAVFNQLQSDLNYFSTQEGIPSTTLVIQYSNGTPPSNSSCYDAGETTQDIEATHAFAPNATIVIATASCAPANATQDNLIDTINQNYGNVISNSWGGTEAMASPASLEPALMYAAATGVSVNFSSGDSGDGIVKFGRLSIAYPASSAWATAVGGTSLLLDQNNNYLTETAWGSYSNTSYTCATLGTTTCLQYRIPTRNTPVQPLFQGGSTGGISTFNVAPSWQQLHISSLYAGGYGIVGSFNHCGSSNKQPCRATPDISMLADGNTGMQGYRTVTSTPLPFIADGTSLACPLFSALIALADQERASLGKTALGLISSYVYSLPPGAVRPTPNPHGIGNPVVGIPNPNAFQLFYVQPNTADLTGFSFGQDTSLTTGKFWGDTNGVGTPYAPTFIQALASK